MGKVRRVLGGIARSKKKIPSMNPEEISRRDQHKHYQKGVSIPSFKAYQRDRMRRNRGLDRKARGPRTGAGGVMNHPIHSMNLKAGGISRGSSNINKQNKKAPSLSAGSPMVSETNKKAKRFWNFPIRKSNKKAGRVSRG